MDQNLRADANICHVFHLHHLLLLGAAGAKKPKVFVCSYLSQLGTRYCWLLIEICRHGQIVCNIRRDARKSLHPNYIIGISLTRLVVPLYFFACPQVCFPSALSSRVRPFAFRFDRRCLPFFDVYGFSAAEHWVSDGALLLNVWLMQ